jgi:hypothetical protein
MTVPDRSMRISDAERDTAIERLKTAQSEGRLAVSDFDERLGRLYAAQTYHDVDVLFTDLPMSRPPQQPTWPGYPPQQPWSGGFQQQPWPGGFPQQPAVGPVNGPATVVHTTFVNQPMSPAMMMQPNSGAATAGMVLGILGLVAFWVPFGDILLSALAVLFSGIGLSQTSGNRMAGHGRAVAGMICGALGLIPAVLVVVALMTAAAFI